MGLSTCAALATRRRHLPSHSHSSMILSSVRLLRFAFLPLVALCGALALVAQEAAPAPAAKNPVAPHLPVWEAGLGDFSEAAYRYAVEQVFQQWERTNGRELKPGEKHKVGLK